MFCSNCKRQVSKNECYCFGCGKIIKIPLTINIASILEIIRGLLEVLISISVVFLQFSLKTKGLNSLRELFILHYGLILGLVLFVWGALDLIIGLELRRLKVWAGHLAIVSALGGIVSYLLPSKNISLSLAYLLIIILILIGWKSFKKVF